VDEGAAEMGVAVAVVLVDCSPAILMV